jgi:hypothetical protein
MGRRFNKVGSQKTCQIQTIIHGFRVKGMEFKMLLQQ